MTAVETSARNTGMSLDPSYPWKAIPLLALAFGLVGLDRFIINPLFPVMTKQLQLSYQDLGLVSGVLALTWGGAAIFCGGIADRFGAKRILVPAIIVFSVLAGLTGLATGLLSLLAVRALMGLAEGAFIPAGIAATTNASPARLIGLNSGIAFAAIGLIGLGLAPVIATQLLNVMPSWRWVFGLVSVPGLLLAAILQHVLRDRQPSVSTAVTVNDGHSWGELRAAISHRNIQVAALCAACWLSSMIVIQAFMPNYLTDHLKLTLDEMGLILAALGIGAVIGQIGLAALSDRFGRKPVLLGAAVVELATLLLLSFSGAEPAILSGLLFFVGLTNAGMIVITVGPIATQSVPMRLAASASGVVVGIGEIIGGALAPALAGTLANAVGITSILQVATGMIAIGFLVTLLGLREPSAHKS